MWNSKHAAHRYFRRKGATIDTPNKVVIFHKAIDVTRKVCQKHTDTMKKEKYDFSRSLFSTAEI